MKKKTSYFVALLIALVMICAMMPACSESITYTVTFDLQNESSNVEQTYEEGDTIVAPTNPTIDRTDEYSYTFNGWNTRADGTGLTLKEGDTASKDVTYYAMYISTKNAYSITFGDVTTAYAYGDTIIAPTAPAKEATTEYTYSFVEWNTKADGTGDAFAIGEVVKGNAVYYAIYDTVYIYSVTFKVNGETIAVEAYSDNNTNINEPDVPAVLGYIGEWESYSVTTGNIVVNAVYTVDESFELVSTEAELLDALAVGGGIILENDIDTTASISVSESFAIQGNGNSINYAGSASLQYTGMFYMNDTLDKTYNFTNLTLNDSVSNASGIIMEGSVGGDLILDNVDMTAIKYYALRVNHHNWASDERTTFSIVDSNIEGWCALYLRGSKQIDVDFDNCNLTGINKFSGDSNNFATISIQYSGTSGADYRSIEDINLTLTDTNIYAIQTTETNQTYIGVNSGDPYIADEINIVHTNCTFYQKDVYGLSDEVAEQTEYTVLTSAEVAELIFFNDYCGFDSLQDVTLTIDGVSVEPNIWRLSEYLIYLYEANYPNEVAVYPELTRYDFVISYYWSYDYYTYMDNNGDMQICYVSSGELDMSGYTTVATSTYLDLYISTDFLEMYE